MVIVFYSCVKPTLMLRRRQLLAGLGIAAMPLLSGCGALGNESGHANLVDIVVENERQEPSTIGVRLWTAEADELIRDHRFELPGVEDSDDTGQLLNCDWPYQEPIIARAALLGDRGEVIDTLEIDTRDVDAGCLSINFYADRNDELLSRSASGSCDEGVMPNAIESCESA